MCYPCKNCGSDFKVCISCDLYNGKYIEIPDNATNDDVLKALFDERGYMGIHDRMMHTKWLFTPYQRGGK